VAVLDEQGAPVAPGTTGRIFVGSELAFDGYTGATRATSTPMAASSSRAATTR
jgi:hypothetical protein